MSTQIKEFKTIIAGERMSASDGATMNIINPANGAIIAKAPKCGISEVNLAVAAALKAAPEWASKTVGERSKVLLKLSQLIMANLDELAKLETMEHGSPIRKTMNFDIPLCAEQLEYFAGVGRALTGETLPVGPWCTSMAIREPLGVVGLITPWNFPALMVVWKLGAALITGNTVIVKPPSITPLTTIRLAELAMEAGVPAGAVNVVTGPGELVGEAMVQHPDVAKIGFTGDTVTGKRIMSLASSTVKQVGLELGGKNAFIVLSDADLDSAVEGAIFSAYFNTGQVCAAASRFYIHESLYDQFAAKFVEASKSLKYGDPMNMETVLGPVAYAAHRDKIEGYIGRARNAGAELLLGGERPDTPDTKDGFYVAPTVFGNCSNDMEIMRDEIFGPVIALCKFKTNEEAVALANDTKYGLCASVWTRDLRTGLQLASHIQAGTVWVNEHLMIFCETPWGGCKESGWGKDLSTMVLKEYTKTKHIYLDLSPAPVKPWYMILK
ncbi:Betaine aldehyde dehydrogenase [Pelotomaculum sp. FP]|uniref:aldehyde dehydrogenase family protein n=1 Tax=Pelotomaculum sp. FP TaxID=261474 RepID=UPI0010646614|nr:aldehyde dehydrogenase family protein [Pelotomaculum sp. FP]TEB13282.1 Betaine aldehyde dehydrogenase [Pelotomaculum sp. FP]